MESFTLSQRKEGKGRKARKYKEIESDKMMLKYSTICFKKRPWKKEAIKKKTAEA
jgi:hypothetical protein